ncbi:hypothetical protein [Cellulomonas sp. ATA003]|uniref:hypothetical protein n=1 Tax=Cellulomonas sp. ATA003 TaxID=3073064 RepID=UPI0037BE3A6D
MPATAFHPAHEGEAWFAGVRARHPVECVDLTAGAATVTRGGFWAVVGEFDGPVRAWRFTDVTHDDDIAHRAPPSGTGGDAHHPAVADHWDGPSPDAWRTSLDRTAYVRAVERVREAVRAGDVYQANVCRVLAAALDPPAGPAKPAGTEPSARALADVLHRGNPAPYAGGVHVPAASGLPPHGSSPRRRSSTCAWPTAS